MTNVSKANGLSQKLDGYKKATIVSTVALPACQTNAKLGMTPTLTLICLLQVASLSPDFVVFVELGKAVP